MFLPGDRPIIAAHSAAIMTFIHERDDWPEFTWDSSHLAEPLAALRHAQGRHLGRLEALGFDLRTEANLTILTEDLVKSWAIEGETIDPAEVRSSIASRLGLDVAGLPRAARDVEGVVETMLDAVENFRAPLTIDRLQAWHAALFPTGRSGLRPITVGRWRPAEVGPMQIVSAPLGREQVHFEAPVAERLDEEVARFLRWFNEPPAIDHVLRAGIGHLWFVTIHPFEDGNGRIARAIGDMALCAADGTSDRYYSLSAQIEAERRDYYDELESAQRGTLDVTAWLDWFLACLGRAIVRADGILESVRRKARFWQEANRFPLHDRQRRVLERLLNDFEGFLTNAKHAKIAKCSRDTALRDIRDLLARGLLLKNPGGGRGTSYRLADPGS